MLRNWARWGAEVLLQALQLMLQSQLFEQWALKAKTIMQPFGTPIKIYGGNNPPNDAVELELPDLLDNSDDKHDEEDEQPHLGSSEGVDGLLAFVHQASPPRRCFGQKVHVFLAHGDAHSASDHY